MTDRAVGRRRLLVGAAAGASSLLAGCGGVFVDSGTPTESFRPPDSGGGSGSTGSTPTATPIATATPANVGTVVEVTNTRLRLRPSDGRYNTLVTVRLTVENVGERPIHLLNLRSELLYLGEGDGSRSLAVDFVGRRFEDDSPFEVGNEVTMRYDTRFPRDGRADRSDAPADFDLAVAVRRVEFA